MPYERDGQSFSAEEIKTILRNEKNGIIKPKKGRTAEVVRLSTLENASCILDIGSEIGAFLGGIAERFPNIIRMEGLECNPKTYQIAKEFIASEKIAFTLHDCGTLPFADQTFDRVFMQEVLEHVRDVNSLLREVNRVLQNHGLLILSVPNATWWHTILKSFLLSPRKLAGQIESWPQFTPDQRDHVNNYDFTHLYRILTLNGFRLKDFAYTGWGLPLLGRIPGFRIFCPTLVLCVEKHS